MDYEEILANATDKLEKYSSTAAGYVNNRVEQVSLVVQEKLVEYPWIPEWIVPKPPPPPPPPAVLETMTRWERAQEWILRNKFLVAAIAIGTGYAGYKIYRKSMLLGKTRRAMRAKTGGRCEVVIIAGSPSLPLTRCLALDLERKGFIVFVVCNTIEEEMMVQNLSRPDVRPLSIDMKDVSNKSAAQNQSIKPLYHSSVYRTHVYITIRTNFISPKQQPTHCSSSIERFAHFMHTPHSAVPKVKPTYLNLTSVILIPSLNYQTSPIATIPRSSFSDLFNTHLLNPILLIQAFLPLLTAQLNPFSKEHPPKVLVFTPSIVSSINPPFHAPESTICSALSAFTDVLGAELQPLKIPVTQFQLGSFDFSGFSPAMGRSGMSSHASAGFHPNTATSAPAALAAPSDTDALPWHDGAKAAYGKNFVATATSSISTGTIGGLRGSSLRDLHNAVFDVLDGSEKSPVVRIGFGANVYGFVGRWAPRGLVSWMMGMRQVEDLYAWQVEPGSDEDDDDDDSEDEEDEECASATAGSTFVNVDGEHNANVWRESSV
ncbi:hypothetical protein MKZ38_008927 [Zalerion maritima]|uniref:DUF1776-domain-containing protein n=1 Tax=Zalerion maritima TaxID=339359 RepID=A0AAD5WNC9_9PEZI|nr:hypothetical protein MKZ38_008927 [Zalerion maritima]